MDLKGTAGAHRRLNLELQDSLKLTLCPLPSFFSNSSATLFVIRAHERTESQAQDTNSAPFDKTPPVGRLKDDCAGLGV